MEKAIFLDIGCVAFDDIGMPLVHNRHTIFRYTGYKASYMSENKVISEEDMAKKYLYSGRGVFYEGKIYFIDTHKESDTLRKYKISHDKKLNQIKKADELNKQFLNGVLYENLYNVSHFDIAQTIITFYENGIFTQEKAIEKLSKYVNPESAEEIIQKLHSLEQQGVG